MWVTKLSALGSINVINKVMEFVKHLDDARIEIRRAPKRAKNIAYITLTPIGARPGDKIIVISNSIGLLVLRGE